MVDEIKEVRRSFTNGDVEYFIGNPIAEDIRGADWQYSKVFTKCLNEGIPTSSEMLDILRRRGIIGDAFDKRAKELSTNLSELVYKLYEADNNEDKAALALEVSRAREALFQWNQRLSGPMNNTCEQMADDARLEFLTACMIQDEAGNRLWESYNDFLKHKDQTLTLKARYEVMLLLQGYEPDFLDRTPEAIAMKEIEEAIRTKVQEEASKPEESTLLAEVAVETSPIVLEEKPKKNIKPVKK